MQQVLLLFEFYDLGDVYIFHLLGVSYLNTT